VSGQKGRSGRPPKDTALHLVDGTFREDRHGDLEEAKRELAAAMTAPVPRMPSWLTSDVAKAEWRRCVKFLHDRGLMHEGKVTLLAAYCEAVAMMVETARQIGDEAPAGAATLFDTPLKPRGPAFTVPAGEGSEKLNPVVQAHDQAAKRVAALARDLGLTHTTAKGRGAGEKDDSLDSFVRGSGKATGR